MYDLIQNFLTDAITFTATAGFCGIVLHHAYTSTMNEIRSWGIPSPTPAPAPQLVAEEVEAMTLTECNDEALIKPTLEPRKQQEVAEDHWETPIISSPARYWMRPAEALNPMLCLPAAKEIVHQQTKKSHKSTPSFPTFQNYSEARLRKIAKEMKIKRYSVLSRAELMSAIARHPAAVKFA